MKVDALLDKGDLGGAAVWRRIVAAINEIQREKPGPLARRVVRNSSTARTKAILAWARA